MVYEEYGFKKMSFDKIERHGRTKYSTLDVSVRGKKITLDSLVTIHIQYNAYSSCMDYNTYYLLWFSGFKKHFFLIIIFLNMINICHFHTCFKMGIM